MGAAAAESGREVSAAAHGVGAARGAGGQGRVLVGWRQQRLGAGMAGGNSIGLALRDANSHTQIDRFASHIYLAKNVE